MDLHFSIANFANIAKAKQLVEMIICSCLSGLYVLGHHHRLLLHYQHDDRSFRPPESLWAWPSWLHWHQHGSEQGAKELLSSFLEQTNHHLFTKISPGKMKVRTIIKKLSTKLKESENLVKLMELQRDLVIIIIFHPFWGLLRIKVCVGFVLVIIAMH